MSDKTELLPCPFCGGHARLRQEMTRDRALESVTCDDCHIRFSRNTADDAAAAWNRRAKVERLGKAWTDTSCGLPADDTLVLLEFSDGDVWPGYRDGDIWRDTSAMPIEEDRVTGWMHMPAARQKNEQEG